VSAVTALRDGRPRPRPRLRELRIAADLTQQQVADKLLSLAWMRGDEHAGVNADMVAKWERGEKGISARYRILLCHLFGVTPDQLLGITPTTATASQPRPARDSESLLSMLDNTATMLDQLGAAGTALAPQMLSAWHQATNTRRTMLGLLDPAATDPAGHARMITATIDDLEHLATRYTDLYETADPVALHHTVTAHVNAATRALTQDHPPGDRRRLLRNLAQVATLAGRLAYEDLGDALSGRAYHTLAVDCARETDDHAAAARALGHLAELTHTQGMPAAALTHLTAAHTHAEHSPHLQPWLAALEATTHTDHGDHTTAHNALARTDVAPLAQDDTAGQKSDGVSTELFTALGHAHLRAGEDNEAREYLTSALDQLPTTARRARVLLLLDLATAELRAGDLPAACRHATTAASQLERTPYATGANRLRIFRDTAAASHAEPKILRIIDEHLGHAAA
jgi:transcriptional regulator with XRE-family HTH domain